MTFPTDEIYKMVKSLQLVKIELWMLQQICEYGSLSAKMDGKYSGPYVLRLAEKVQLNLDIKKLAIHSKD